jgi:hypothetical protein
MNNSLFKTLAKQHQIDYREKYIDNQYNTYKTWLSKDSSINGKNFFDGFGIFDIAKQRYPIKDLDSLYGKDIDVFSDMLRSEHIPLNFFVPLRYDLNFCRNVFNRFLGNAIKQINKNAVIDGKENIKIEFSPSPMEEFLADNTSFDTYIEYELYDGSLGLLGIEVKYTEKEYQLKKNSKEEKEINNPMSKYYEISKKSSLYKKANNGYSNNPKTNILKDNEFRQIWRNHLLAESIILHDNSKIKHSSSLLFYPAKNDHFTNVGEKYSGLLNKNKDKFILITYEEYFLACYKYCPNDMYKKWIDYLYERYIV